MGMEGQGQPVAAAHGRSLNHNYRVCCSLQGFDHRDTLVRVKLCARVCVCACACVCGHRIIGCVCVACVCLEEKLAGTAGLKKTTTREDAGLKSTKRETQRENRNTERRGCQMAELYHNKIKARRKNRKQQRVKEQTARQRQTQRG